MIEGDGSPEGELSDDILDQLARYERAKIAERTRHGKLRKAREGKVVPGCKPNYGFALNENRDGYVVVEDEMLTVRRIFSMIGVEGMDIAGVKKTLDREGVPTPGGARYRSRTLLKRIVLADVYKPHTKKRRPGRQSLSRQISSVVAFRK